LPLVTCLTTSRAGKPVDMVTTFRQTDDTDLSYLGYAVKAK
jgi:hypothetical protein